MIINGYWKKFYHPIRLKVIQKQLWNSNHRLKMLQLIFFIEQVIVYYLDVNLKKYILHLRNYNLVII
jgi:hypothetical protein